MSALPQKRTFSPGQPNVRYAPKAVIGNVACVSRDLPTSADPAIRTSESEASWYRKGSKTVHRAKKSSSYVAALLAALSVCSTVLAQPKEALPPGRLIHIGQRKVHLFCEGSGGPTVIIEVGSSTPARVWRGVQDKIAAFTHVCAYDRAGYGWSDPEPKPRTMDDRAQELHNVLQTGGEHPPYILLGHSYGGFLVRLFAKDHPGEAIGMVLVDAAEEGSFFSPAAVRRWDDLDRLLRAEHDKAVRENPQLVPYYAAIQDELASNRKVPSKMRKPGGFGRVGNMPLVVLAHNKPFTGIDAPLEPGWRAGEERLAALSTGGKLVVAMNSGHNIEISEPDLIVTAVKEVLDEARSTQTTGPKASP